MRKRRRGAVLVQPEGAAGCATSGVTTATLTDATPTASTLTTAIHTASKHVYIAVEHD